MKLLSVNGVILSLLAIFAYNLEAVNTNLAKPVVAINQTNKAKVYNNLLKKYPALKKLNNQKAIAPNFVDTLKKHKIALADIKSIKVPTVKTYPKNNPISKYRIIITTKTDKFTIKPSKSLIAKKVTYQVKKEKIATKKYKDTFLQAYYDKYGSK
ncbi:MAG: hypothetical protein P4L22_06325 [Candidatus Babeliales bacterium]|nr:hypothetical protein [Candidatus Babeliales bacterium]